MITKGDTRRPRIGQWVCPPPLYRDSLCYKPVEVTDVTDSMIKFRSDVAEDRNGRMLIRNIAFVADTKAEADAAYQLSSCLRDSIKSIRDSCEQAILEFTDPLSPDGTSRTIEVEP